MALFMRQKGTMKLLLYMSGYFFLGLQGGDFLKFCLRAFLAFLDLTRTLLGLSLLIYSVVAYTREPWLGMDCLKCLIILIWANRS